MDTLFNTDFLRFAASLGVGGVIAAGMFWVYRKDVQRYTEQWQGQSELLLSVVKDNTKAMTQNTEVMRALVSRLDRIEHER